jgi:hypothetical protein
VDLEIHPLLFDKKSRPIYFRRLLKSMAKPQHIIVLKTFDCRKNITWRSAHVRYSARCRRAHKLVPRPFRASALAELATAAVVPPWAQAAAFCSLLLPGVLAHHWAFTVS